ncbi:MAG: PD-(D/E)XK nuclease domain-containing protein, partial [Succinivibrio sp.]|nr:PD-(D/E)XK nuclease domain-containing protein [Succinivibrio sp.]
RDSAHEDFYHGFLSGVLSVALDDETLKSDTESGDGYADLLLYSDYLKVAAILEFKKVADGEDYDSVCAGALSQIEEKRYAAPFEQKKYTILKYGIAFRGKKCLVLMPD